MDRDEYQAKIKAQLADVASWLDKTKESLKDETSELKEELEEKTQLLKEKGKVLNDQLAKLGDASEEKWDEFREEVEDAYGDVRSSLEKRGEVIGPHDLLIAAHALSLDQILVTNNEGEFKRVEGLKVDNWAVEG